MLKYKNVAEANHVYLTSSTKTPTALLLFEAAPAICLINVLFKSRIGQARARGGRAENKATAVRVHFEVHRLSFQCQTADRHDKATDEDHETAVGDSMLALSGISMNSQ